MKNIIIGKNSSLTVNLKKKLKNTSTFSARELSVHKKDNFFKFKKKEKINIIFNNFYPSSKISNLSSKNYLEFVNLGLVTTINVLNKIKKENINKIIYNSSASIYGTNIENLKDLSNRKFSSSFKFATENLIFNYCKKNKIDFNILRLFNIYSGPEDNFSVIGKIVKSHKSKKFIYIDNKGESLRDFIHINDVTKIITILLKKKTTSNIIDVGTGYGVKIKDILNFLNFPKKLIKFRKNTDEIGNSISNNQNLLKEVNYRNFVSLEKILKKKYKKKVNGFIKKYKFKNNLQEENSENSYVIYGAGNVGKQVFNQLKLNKEKIAFFVDDNPKLQGKYYKGVKIISLNEIKKIALEKELSSVIISIANLEKDQLEKIKNSLKSLVSNIIYLPTKNKLISDKIDLNDALSVGVEDIIGRKEIVVPKTNDAIKNKNILVTGAGGSIGSELCRQIEVLRPKKIIAIDFSEIAIFNLKKYKLKNIKYILADITDMKTMNKIFIQNNIDHVFHAAAYKHLNILENNVSSAIKNNIIGTYNVLKSSIINNSNFTFISTDKAADPTSILGKSKRFAEIICQYFRSRNKKIEINIVRFGNVFGSLGSAVPTFIEQINNNQEITITDKRVKRYFMTIKEACLLVLETVNLRIKNKTFILNMGKPVKIINIIKFLIKLKKDINPDFKFKIKEIGLQKGEKINEKLISNKEKLIKINKNIFIIKEKKINENSIKKIISNFENPETKINLSLNQIKRII